MENRSSLIVSVSTISDLDKITKDTKYINLDITNPNDEIIKYFVKHGIPYMYSDLIVSTSGYNYVSYDEFVKAENIIDVIYKNMPGNLNELEMAKYLYVSVCKYVSWDINTNQNKNEVYNLSLLGTVNNLWGSLSLGIVNDNSASKIYYYLCRKLGIDNKIIYDEENRVTLNKLSIYNQVLITNLYSDIPYIKCKMKTRYFAIYNDDVSLDKKIKYLKGNYNDYNFDKVLRDIDYMKEDCVYKILSKTLKIIDINSIKPVELSVIYSYIFNKYCPNYNIKINNMFLNKHEKLHFIMISYNDSHYSYNYRQNVFVEVNDEEIINNISTNKIGLYCDEDIPNINYFECVRRNC